MCIPTHTHTRLYEILLHLDLTSTFVIFLEGQVDLFSMCSAHFAVVLTVTISLFSAPGGTRIDDGDKTKMTNHCVFSAKEDHETIRNHAQVELVTEKFFCWKGDLNGI